MERTLKATQLEAESWRDQNPQLALSSAGWKPGGCLWDTVRVALPATEPLPPTWGTLLQPRAPSSAADCRIILHGELPGRELGRCRGVGADTGRRLGCDRVCWGPRKVPQASAGDKGRLLGRVGGSEAIPTTGPLHLSEFNSSLSGQTAQQVQARSKEQGAALQPSSLLFTDLIPSDQRLKGGPFLP